MLLECSNYRAGSSTGAGSLQNAALVEKLASAAQNLQNLARKLLETVSVFHLDNEILEALQKKFLKVRQRNSMLTINEGSKNQSDVKSDYTTKPFI